MSEQHTFEDLVAAGVLEVGDGYRAKVEELGGDGPIFLRAGRLTADGLIFAGAERFQASSENFTAKLGRPGDTVVTTKGNSVGRAGFVPEDAPTFVYSPHLSYWRSKDVAQLHPGFLRYWARSPEFLRQLRALGHGTDMAPYLSLVDQRRLRITLPPLAGQHRIASVLGAIDNLRDANSTAVPAAHRLALAVLDQAAQGRPQQPVAEVASVRRGLSYTGAGLAESGMPMVNLANAANFGWLKRGGFKYYNGPYKPRHVAAPGALLVSGVEQTWRAEILGWPLLLPEDVGPALFSQDMFIVDFTPGQEWLRLPLWAYLYSAEARARIEAFAYGTTVARFPVDAITGMAFPVPDQQSPALELAEALLRRAWAAEVESQRLAELRDLLLPGLMSGRIRVKDAEGVVAEAV